MYLLSTIFIRGIIPSNKQFRAARRVSFARFRRPFLVIAHFLVMLAQPNKWVYHAANKASIVAIEHLPLIGAPGCVLERFTADPLLHPEVIQHPFKQTKLFEAQDVPTVAAAPLGWNLYGNQEL